MHFTTGAGGSRKKFVAWCTTKHREFERLAIAEYCDLNRHCKSPVDRAVKQSGYTNSEFAHCVTLHLSDQEHPN